MEQSWYWRVGLVVAVALFGLWVLVPTYCYFRLPPDKRNTEAYAKSVPRFPLSPGADTRLNLGLDSFIFIDDNPVECAEVRAGCPDVLTLEWPLDPARAELLLRHTWELDPRNATAEDQRRTELYREEFHRQEAQAQTLTFRDFIASLDLQVDIAPLAPADLKRSSQLTLRTNQFNFTTIRRRVPEIQQLLGEGKLECLVVEVEDRELGHERLLLGDVLDRLERHRDVDARIRDRQARARRALEADGLLAPERKRFITRSRRDFSLKEGRSNDWIMLMFWVSVGVSILSL